MIFYNGFNMLIDAILVTIASLFFYRAGWWAGYKTGISDAAEEDERWYKETDDEHWLEEYRINNYPEEE